jgi:glycoside/pentoside/hexuronide:cation symporter, GPH family
VYWLMVKLGTSFALVTSGAVLNLVGFDQKATVQSVESLTNLRIADILIPIITGLIAILIMWKYDMTEARAHEIRQALVTRRGEVLRED